MKDSNLEEYIDSILEYEYSRIESNTNDPFLQKGTMGIIIFLFWAYEFTENSKYKEKADDLLDLISESISSRSLLEIYNGITGIGLGIIYLHNKGFINENLDYLLKSIDDYIYLNIVSILDDYNTRYENTVLDLLLYLYYRIRTSNDENNILIFKHIWHELFNKMCQNMDMNFFIEPNPSELKYKLPYFMLLCSCGCRLGNIIKGKVVKTVNEYENFCLSYFPLLQFNRLTLFHAIDNLGKEMQLNGKWQTFKTLLKENLSYEYIVDQEMSANDIYVTHGVSCLYFLLKFTRIPITKSLATIIVRKIQDSELFKLSEQRAKYFDYYGLDGKLGTIIVLTELKQIINGKI